MRRVSIIFGGVVFCGLFFAASASAEEKYTLRYRFRPGETLRWNVEHRTEMRTTVSGQTETARTDTRSVKAWRVREVRPDGTAVFEHLVEEVDMWNKLAGSAEVRYNSRTDKKPPVGFEDAAAAVGVPLMVITLNPQGKVLKRQRKLSATATQSEGDLTVPLPEKPIAVGQSWSQPCDIDVPLESGGVKKIKAVQRFTLESVKTQVARIRVATLILTPINNPAIEAKVAQHESSGAVRFDLDAGRILSQQIDVDKHVVGFRGGASSLHYRTRFREEFLSEPARTAGKGKEKS